MKNSWLCVILYVYALLLATAAESSIENEADENVTTASPPPGQGGRSFFLFGGFFRKFRNRWLGQTDPVPLYAGPAFPLAGYYNCPVYGCNPAVNYRPAPYEPTDYYNRPVYPYNPVAPPPVLPLTPQQQQQPQQTQQSNVVIYQNGQQQQQQQPGYYAPRYPPPPHTTLPNPYGGSQFYPTAPAAALPAPAPLPFPPLQAGVGAYPPTNNGVAVVGYPQGAPQYPANNFNGYNLPPPEASNYQPPYAANPYLPGGPAHTPICPPHVYPCPGGG